MKFLIFISFVFISSLVKSQEHSNYFTFEIHINSIQLGDKNFTYLDTGAFHFRLFSGMKSETYRNGHVFSIIPYPFYRSDTSNLELTYSLHIYDKTDKFNLAEVQLRTVIANNCKYLIDTLDFKCGFSRITISGNDSINHIGRDKFMVNSRSYPQDFKVPDSVFTVQSEELLKNHQLKKLNEFGISVNGGKRTNCSDSIISGFTWNIAKKKKTHIEFYANGNIKRVYNTKDSHYWKFFYRTNDCYLKSPYGKCKFYVAKRFHLTKFKDSCVNYYPNGKKYKVIKDFQTGSGNAKKVVNAWDSNGVQTLINENGFYYEYPVWGGYHYYCKVNYCNGIINDTLYIFTNKKIAVKILYQSGVPVYSEFNGINGEKRFEIYDPKKKELTWWNISSDGKTSAKQKITDKSYPKRKTHLSSVIFSPPAE